MKKFRDCDFQLETGDVAFLDFVKAEGSLKLERISFDGHGCCGCAEKGVPPMDRADAQRLLALVESGVLDQPVVRKLVVKYCEQIKGTLWTGGTSLEDALEEHGLLRYE